MSTLTSDFQPSFSLEKRIDVFNSATEKIFSEMASTADLDLDNPDLAVDSPDKYRLIPRRRLGLVGDGLELFLVSTLVVVGNQPETYGKLCSLNITMTSILSGIHLSYIKGVGFPSYSGPTISNFSHELLVPVSSIEGWNE